LEDRRSRRLETASHFITSRGILEIARARWPAPALSEQAARSDSEPRRDFLSGAQALEGGARSTSLLGGERTVVARQADERSILLPGGVELPGSLELNGQVEASERGVRGELYRAAKGGLGFGLSMGRSEGHSQAVPGVDVVGIDFERASIKVDRSVEATGVATEIGNIVESGYVS
jgi:hypothetical protein